MSLVLLQELAIFLCLICLIGGLLRIDIRHRLISVATVPLVLINIRIGLFP